MTSSERHDLSHLPAAGPEEVRAMLKAAGIDLPEDLLAQFVAAWPNYEAMVRRIPRRRTYAEEPAHVFRPGRLAPPAEPAE